MRIGVLHPAFGAWGGAEALIAWGAAALQSRGHEVTVLSGCFSRLAREQMSSVRLENVTHMRGAAWQRLTIRGSGVGLSPLADHVVRLDRRAMQNGASQLARQLARHDVVLAVNFPATWWLLPVTERPPTLWYCHEPPRSMYAGLFDGAACHFVPDGSELQAWDRLAGRAPQAVAGNSRYGHERVRAIYGRDDRDWLYPGLPIEPAVARRSANGGRLEILCVSRLTAHKNVAVAIEAMRHVPHARLRIAGEGPSHASLQALVDRLELRDRVELLGFVGFDDMSALRAESDAFLYLPLGEPFGLAVVEASLAGLPSVVSDHGGPSEIVVEGETGFHADPRSPQSVAAALERLRAAPPLGEAARARALEHFSIERHVEQMERMLCGLTSEIRPAASRR